MIKITKVSSNGVEGSADFWWDEMNKEIEGTLHFRITKQQGRKSVSVLDPFGGQNPQGYQKLVQLLEFELTQQGHI